MAGRALLIVEVDVLPEHEARFDQWYNDVHIPALLTVPGFLAARRFVRQEGSPKFLALYELESEAALEHPQLARVRGWGEFEPLIRNLRRSVCRRIYPGPEQP